MSRRREAQEASEGDLSSFFDGLAVTVDDPDGAPREAGLVESVQVQWNRGTRC